MKDMIFLFVAMALSACSDSTTEEPFDIDSFPQRWELTSMSGSVPNFLLEGDDLPWKETISLNQDETFKKVREIDGEQFDGTGSFFFESSEGNKYLILEYSQETDLIESCTREKFVERFFLANTESLSGGSAPCDGPGLFYSRVE